MLLVLALSAFIIERVRRLSDREVTSRIMLLALVPTLLVMAEPDIGTGIVGHDLIENARQPRTVELKQELAHR